MSEVSSRVQAKLDALAEAVAKDVAAAGGPEAFIKQIKDELGATGPITQAEVDALFPNDPKARKMLFDQHPSSNQK